MAVFVTLVRMKLAALALVPVCITVAHADVAAVYQGLQTPFKEYIGLLQTILQPQDVAAVLPRLLAIKAQFDQLSAYHEDHPQEQADFIAYIENDHERKQTLIKLFQSYIIEQQRLEDAAYFGSEQLRALLVVKAAPSAPKTEAE